MRFRRQMLVLGLTILFIQSIFMPAGMVYAETTMNTEEHEPVDLPSIPPFLEELTSEPNFFFHQSHMQGIVHSPINVRISSDQEVSEAKIRLPEEATIIEDHLPERISVVEGEQPYEWIVQSESVQTTFVIPLIFESTGKYELSVKDITATVEINIAESIADSSSNESSITPEIEPSESNLNNDKEEDLKDNTSEEPHKNDELPGRYQNNPSVINDIFEFQNSFFNYGQRDQFIDGWSLFIGPGILGPLTELNISNTLASDSEFRYAFDGTETVDRVLFRKKSDNEGLRVRLKEDTTLIAGQSFKTVPGKEYLVRGDFTGDSRRGLIVYEGEVFAGSGGITSTIGLSGLPEVSFIAKSSIYSISSRLFALIGEEVGESSINSVVVGEKVTLKVKYLDDNGNEIHGDGQFYGIKGEEYKVEPIGIPGYIFKSSTENYSGVLSENETIIFEYATEKIHPVDPINPELEVTPENIPILPEEQGLLSIDFVSSLDFGSQAISVHDQTYYAQPQRLLNEDGTVNESKERPNYVQISDRRPENERNGWQLAVTQKEQFKGKENQELKGASLSLSNQQVVTAQGGATPGLQSVPCVLIPGNRRTLLKAQGNEGTGTWIYRFGDAYTQGESVALNVPKGATPKATTYSTTLIWELSAVPMN
ncbi:WxL domain-containing protein [Enterococcus casseliflavus]|uniref:WxL domain-containing protein n=1 Tax=Enterococcus casseliflavus TaxID=37734 RepID=UPI0022E840A0|nr:WxL domain-containing protein [Enterococcus casseliflavus]MEB6088113.1 WxL domain-containing protein [Enterococcus casseliflavus]